MLFEGLVEPFHLAAGGRMVGCGVDLHDSLATQFLLKSVASALTAGEARGEDHAVVGECGERNAMPFNGFTE